MKSNLQYIGNCIDDLKLAVSKHELSLDEIDVRLTEIKKELSESNKHQQRIILTLRHIAALKAMEIYGSNSYSQLVGAYGEDDVRSKFEENYNAMWDLLDFKTDDELIEKGGELNGFGNHDSRKI